MCDRAHVVPVGNDGLSDIAKRHERGKREEDGFVAALVAALAHELPLVSAADVVVDEAQSVRVRLGLTFVLANHRTILRRLMK